MEGGEVVVEFGQHSPSFIWQMIFFVLFQALVTSLTVQVLGMTNMRMPLSWG
jgi:hypothetical protein